MLYYVKQPQEKFFKNHYLPGKSNNCIKGDNFNLKIYSIFDPRENPQVGRYPY